MNTQPIPSPEPHAHPATPQEPARSRGTTWQERLLSGRARVLLCFALILLVAAALRFVGLDWDQGTHLNPDERFLTMVESSMPVYRPLSVVDEGSLVPHPCEVSVECAGFRVVGTDTSQESRDGRGRQPHRSGGRDRAGRQRHGHRAEVHRRRRGRRALEVAG